MALVSRVAFHLKLAGPYRKQIWSGKAKVESVLVLVSTKGAWALICGVKHHAKFRGDCAGSSPATKITKALRVVC